MANFNEEFKKVILVEGGYVNDPDDAGGETYLGISRRYNPDSKMWNIIDDIKKQFGTKGINSRLKNNQEITNEVKQIYKINYWDKLELDDIPSQKIAHELFYHSLLLSSLYNSSNSSLCSTGVKQYMAKI
jgi:lysozyme family protein